MGQDVREEQEDACGLRQIEMNGQYIMVADLKDQLVATADGCLQLMTRAVPNLLKVLGVATSPSGGHVDDQSRRPVAVEE